FLLAARNRDFAVVTDRRLLLWSAGFFTRRPRRRVLAERLDELTVQSVGSGSAPKISCRRGGRRPLLLQRAPTEQAAPFARTLLDLTASPAASPDIGSARPAAPAAPPDAVDAVVEPAAAPPPPPPDPRDPPVQHAATQVDGAPAESPG